MRHYFDKFAARVRRLRPAPDEAVAEMRGGYRLFLHPNNDRHERQLYFDRTYEPATLALIDLVLRPGDIMVDVGANLGVMSMHAAKAVGPTGTVVALEPHPVTFHRLTQHVRLNDFENIRPVQIAAGAGHEQRTIFDVPTVNIGRASLIVPKQGGEPAGIIEVNSLDNILSHLGVGPVRLIKIDVEGFEPNVLRGASKVIAQQPVICMEVSATIDRGDDEPLAAHDIIMGTGVYRAFKFKYGKGRACPLVKVQDRDRLARQVNDNVVYVPTALQAGLSGTLFDL